MGIKKRRTDPIRVVSIKCDDAIDESRTNMLDYEETRKPELVKALPGKELTWFDLAPIPPSHVSRIKGYLYPQREMVAFQFGCTGCSDPGTLNPSDWEGSGDDRHIKDRALRGLTDQLWIELGSIALQLGELTVGESRPFASPLGLPAIRRMQPSTNAPSASDKEATPQEESG